jgi:hypothetical protein
LSFRDSRRRVRVNISAKTVCMSTEPKQLASPYSTGGGGDDLQSQVGAYYLTGLLLRHVPRGLDAGTLTEVGSSGCTKASRWTT